MTKKDKPLNIVKPKFKNTKKIVVTGKTTAFDESPSPLPPIKSSCNAQDTHTPQKFSKQNTLSLDHKTNSQAVLKTEHDDFHDHHKETGNQSMLAFHKNFGDGLLADHSPLTHQS